ncbi:MAG: putative tonB-dependent receptor yncD precursor, partial [Phenylobacterium sp.]|nr:putative tonB-dependent receptor yncD precursor [Phenylobacterium sp.]
MTALILLALVQATVGEVVVTARTPLSPEAVGGEGGAVTTLKPLRASPAGSAVLQALEAGAPGVSLSDPSGNDVQRTLVYRGFQASPLQGAAQGLAVYVDGVRFNQPFGDTVNWDLIPDEAVAAVTLEGANPLFGLNALGGSISVRLKTGFSDPGGEAEVAGGSFGRRSASLAYGRAAGGLSVFVAANGEDEQGWRDFSPERVRQLYGDLGARRGGWEGHAGLVLADNHLTGEGPAPVELLAADRSAVFTHPDATRNRFALLRLTAGGPLAPHLALQASGYLGRLRQSTSNGDASDAAPCDADPTSLCLEADGPPLTGPAGAAIPDFLAGGPYAQLNATSTRISSGGLAAHLTAEGRLFGRVNSVTTGAALDAGRSVFSASSTLGALTPDRGFGGPGVVIDQAGGPIAPVALLARNTYAGLYASDALGLTSRLSLNVSARLNRAVVTLSDRRGTALNGRHRFTDLNPAASLTWRPRDGISAYLGYAEASRAPTPAELSCASPQSPCSLASFFVADPPLKPALARTWEAGVRGRRDDASGLSLSWSAGFFRTDTRQDITLLMSEVRGRGFFSNVGRTRRQGLEAQVRAERGRWRGYANAAWTDATFRTALTLSSPDNPAADAAGAIRVEPGDRLPATPRRRMNLGLSYDPGAWRVGFDVRSASSQVFVGDEANLAPPLKGYVVADLDAGLRLVRAAELFVQVRNVADARYATFGTFAQTS